MMMHMPWVIVTFMVFLLLVVSGVFVAVRLLGAHMIRDDQPTSKSGPRS